MEKRFLNIDGFEVVQDRFTEKENKYYEGIFAQGNGYLHVRGSFEEGLADALQDERYTRTMKSVTTEIQRHPLSKQGTFLPLIMGKHPFLEEVIVNLPYFMEIKIDADGEALDMIRSNIADYRRTLNMKSGELKRSFVWLTESGSEIRVGFSRFASLADKHIFVQKMTVEPLKGDPLVRVTSGIDGSVTTNGYCHFTDIRTQAGEDSVKVTVKTDAGEQVVLQSICSLTGMEAKGSPVSEDRHAAVCYEGNPGQKTELVKYSAVGCTRDRCADHEKETEESLGRAAARSYEELLAENVKLWEERWDNADIRVEGCRELQDGLRFSLYHLLRCSTKEEDRIQICAKGFAGEAYYGRYFWDSEMYLLPFYLYTDPSAARSLAGYRAYTLDGARENARRYFCRGARYPWQSGLTGTEQCSLWEYADNEIHITADVAFGILHYYYATGDERFLFDKGMEVLIETSRFWIDRVDTDDRGGYHLLNVMGPDEYSPMTKDNGFTNFMVGFVLRETLKMLDLFRRKRPEQCAELMEKTGITDEEQNLFRVIADSLPIPYDEERGLYLQSADFEDYAKIDMDGLWEDKRRAFGHYVSQEKIYRSRCIKQADTIALMSLFPGSFTDAQVENAYEYYKPLTTHDSSLSPAVHALAAVRLNRDEETARFLEKTLEVDMEIIRKGAEDGIHIANCGALWEMAVFGFMGMKTGYQEDNLKFEPRLPHFIKAMEAPVTWKGRKYVVRADQNGVDIRQKKVPVKGFLFDLDGVLTDTAEFHYLAWKRLADELHLSFDRKVNERLKGVSRERSFEIILEANRVQERFTSEEKTELAARKNRYYRELIAQITPADILPGVEGFLNEAKAAGVLLAVASASRNAQTVLDGLGITSLFDYVSDASMIRYTKPDPEVFTDCMEHLGLAPWECAAFEDAAAGIEAIRAARVVSVGIGESAKEAHPDFLLQSTRELSFAKIKELLNSDKEEERTK